MTAAHNHLLCGPHKVPSGKKEQEAEDSSTSQTGPNKVKACDPLGKGAFSLSKVSVDQQSYVQSCIRLVREPFSEDHKS